jgi:hypothetical protein
MPECMGRLTDAEDSLLSFLLLFETEAFLDNINFLNTNHELFEKPLRQQGQGLFQQRGRAPVESPEEYRRG